MQLKKATDHLNGYGIWLMRRKGLPEQRWLTFPQNDPIALRRFKTIKAAVGYWDIRAKQVVSDHLIAQSWFRTAEMLHANDLPAQDAWLERQIHPKSMLTAIPFEQLPDDWKLIAQSWAFREGSIASVDIQVILKHARLQQMQPPSFEDGSNKHQCKEAVVQFH